jgi:N-acetylmuramoyl-L-alanine amidase
MRLVWAPSPNHDERKHPVSQIVLHYTGMQSGDEALARLRDPAAKVSSHYMVRESGEIVQLVEEGRRAWHAGAGRWREQDDINSRSVGIEIVNGGHDVPCADGSLPPYPDVQIAAVISLVKAILARHGLSPLAVIGHSDLAPTRKTDPGEHFPWARLAAAGAAVHPAEAEMGAGCVWMGADAEGLNTRLAAIGYDVSDPVAAVRAFQRRFTPDRITGFADARTLKRIGEVEREMGVVKA